MIYQALETSGAKPQLVSDNRTATEPKAKNGSQFTASEFKQRVRLFELEHIRIRTYPPSRMGSSSAFTARPGKSWPTKTFGRWAGRAS